VVLTQAGLRGLEGSEAPYQHDGLPSILQQGINHKEQCMAVGKGGEVVGTVIIDHHLLPISLFQCLLPFFGCG